MPGGEFRIMILLAVYSTATRRSLSRSWSHKSSPPNPRTPERHLLSSSASLSEFWQIIRVHLSYLTMAIFRNNTLRNLMKFERLAVCPKSCLFVIRQSASITSSEKLHLTQSFAHVWQSAVRLRCSSMGESKGCGSLPLYLYSVNAQYIQMTHKLYLVSSGCFEMQHTLTKILK